MTHLPSDAPQDACPLTAWGCLAPERQPSWHMVSRHPTSEGEVEYCRCTCAALVILCSGELAAFAGPHRA